MHKNKQFFNLKFKFLNKNKIFIFLINYIIKEINFLYYKMFYKMN